MVSNFNGNSFNFFISKKKKKKTNQLHPYQILI